MFRTSPRTFIQLRVNDVVHDDTRFGQVARLWRLAHEQADDGVCSVQVIVKLLLYGLVGGELGQLLPPERFVELSIPLIGNNDTLVDAETGQILSIRYLSPNTTDNGDWGALCRSFGSRDVMLQGDWFEELREKPAAIGDMIRGHIEQAHNMGKFA